MDSINYQEMIQVAQEKMHFSKDDLIVRLKSFPVSLLNNIKLIDKTFLNDFEKEYKQIITKIEEA